MMFRILVFVIITSLKGVTCLSRPSFISDWHTMDVSDTSTLLRTFTHSFGEIPIYCDVQVRSSSGLIYPGIGSGFVDDDAPGIRGGVIYYYNANEVVVRGPIPGSGESHSQGLTTYVIWTGDSSYVPTNREELTTADVRVRLWRQSDFPPPSQTIATFSVGSNEIYPKVHQLQTVPMMTIVQVHMTNANPSGWVSQAQGSFGYNDDTNSGGGSLFGVNSTHVNVWTTAGAFSYCDGWGSTIWYSCTSTSADVIIKLWSCLESDIIFSNSVSHSIQAASEPASHDVSITVPYSHDDDLIIVRAEATDGTYAGFYFDGLGAAMTDSTSDSDNYYTGGLVYATSNISQTIRMWHPVYYSSCTDCRCIVKVTDSCQQSVNVHTVIVQGTSVSTIPEYSTLPLHGHISAYTACQIVLSCNDTYFYQQGETESFLVNGTWTNTDNPLQCVRCDTVESGTNAILHLHPEMYTTAIYECEPGYSLVSGDLNRTCLELGLNTFGWSGTKPICHAEVTTTTTIPTTTTTTATTTTIVAATTTSAASTTSVPTTPPPPTLPPPVCFNITATSSPEVIEEAVKIAEEISKNLTVDVKKTASFLRSITSATDERASAFYVGMIGYLVFGIVFGLLFLLDMLSVVKYILESRDDSVL